MLNCSAKISFFLHFTLLFKITFILSPPLSFVSFTFRVTFIQRWPKSSGSYRLFLEINLFHGLPAPTVEYTYRICRPFNQLNQIYKLLYICLIYQTMFFLHNMYRVWLVILESFSQVPKTVYMSLYMYKVNYITVFQL